MNIIAHNISAMNAQRQYGINTNQRAKSTEKLSSGYKINQAADDAAGLSISEKMRKQVRGLNQASDNSQDGISLCQVADGALTEVSELLNRITQLSVKSANGTNSDSDRDAIQKEISEIYAEINRIGDTTKFNERPVFNSLTTSTIPSDYKPSTSSEFFQKMKGYVSTGGFMDEKLTADSLAGMNNTHDHGTPNPYVSVHIDLKGYTNSGKQLKDLAGTNFYVNCCTNCCPMEVEFTDSVGISKSGSTLSIGLKKDGSTYYTDASEFATAIVDAGKATNFSSHVEFAEKNGKLFLYDIDNNDWSENEKRLAYFCDVNCEYHGKMEDVQKTRYSDSLTLQIGSESDHDNQMSISIGGLDTKILGLEDGNASTMKDSTELIDKVSYANRIVSSMRGRIGAYQNRLEHTIRNLDNTSENTQAAESAIRDTDMAAEMIKLSMSNILEQAGSSMIAQINQSSQNVLSLLQ